MNGVIGLRRKMIDGDRHLGFHETVNSLRNSCVVLQEKTFLHEIPDHFRTNTKPVLQEIVQSFEIN